LGIPVGLRDWIPGGSEDPDEAANRLRGEAINEPGDVDVEQLAEVLLEADDQSVARPAAKGVAAVAGGAPERLADVVPELIEASTRIEGPVAEQRDDIGEAILAVAEVDSDAVAEHGDGIVDSLQRELEADDAPGYEVRLYEGKTAALCEAAGLARIGDAEPVLKKLRRHHDAEVGDAAREAIRKL
jgi:hypothetical protein